MPLCRGAPWPAGAEVKVAACRQPLWLYKPHKSNSINKSNISNKCALNSANSVNKGNHVLKRTEFTTYGICTRQRPHDPVAQHHATEPRAPARQLTILPERQLVLTCSSALVDWLPHSPVSGLPSKLR
jgi:hypothetical protein